MQSIAPYKADPQRSGMLRLGGSAVTWWSPIEGKENIGDYLTFYFINKLFEGIRVEADVYRLIGSVIAPHVIARDVAAAAKVRDARIAFWGCGCREDRRLPDELLRHASFMAVRGPLSRDVLNLPGETPLGDPALLLPLLYSPRPSALSANRTIFVPHIRDILDHTEERLLGLSQADAIVSPVIDSRLDAVERFIDDVCSARFIIAGSLHAAIIACAYGIPFAFFDTGYVDQPFKWRDFSASIGVGTYFPTNRSDAERVHAHFLEGRIRRPPLGPLLRAAPMRPRAGIMAKAEAHHWSG